MTQAMVTSKPDPVAKTGTPPQSRQPTQGASPSFASVHGAAQASVILVRNA